MAKLRHLRARFQIPPLIASACIFLFTLLSCLLAERTDFFETIEKTSDVRLFVLFVGVSVLASLGSWNTISHPAQAKAIDGDCVIQLLPREQTEEWKGWMQSVILLYHYFGLSKNLHVYQVIRVLVAMYIFLTGYGHTSYFLKNNDFSLDRTAKTLLRLNLLSGVLSYVLNKTCDFYYFPVITSFWYLIIFVTLRCARTSSGNFCLARVNTCLLISSAMVHAVLYSQRGNAAWLRFTSLLAQVGGPRIDAQEFIFRLKLDSLMSYWGALLAVFGTKVDTASSYAERRCRFLHHLAKLHLPWIAGAILIQYFLGIQNFTQKPNSNAWHPFISVIPIACMLILRNATTRQRRGSNHIFAWLGTISLETYILQSHVWLTNNNKGILRMRIMDQLTSKPQSSASRWLSWLDKFIILAFFLLLSHYTAKATKRIIEWLTSGSRRKPLALFVLCWLLNLHWGLISV